MCVKIEGPVWPRDNYGYIRMSANQIDYQTRVPSYNVSQDSPYNNQWAEERQWVPSYYYNQNEADSSKRLLQGIV